MLKVHFLLEIEDMLMLMTVCDLTIDTTICS